MKHCPGCQRDLPATDFYVRRGRELHSRCKACERAYMREYKAARQADNGKRPGRPPTPETNVNDRLVYAILSTPCGATFPLRIFTGKELHALVRTDRLAIGAVVERGDGVQFRVGWKEKFVLEAV